MLRYAHCDLESVMDTQRVAFERPLGLEGRTRPKADRAESKGVKPLRARAIFFAQCVAHAHEGQKLLAIPA